MTKLNRTVAEVEADRLVAAACFTRSCGVTVAAGQGVLKRGSVLGVNSDNKCILLGAQNEDEEVIEAEAGRCVHAPSTIVGAGEFEAQLAHLAQT